MIPAKFLGPRGGTLGAAVEALEYLRDLKNRYSLNMVATSNSWGGGGFSQVTDVSEGKAGCTVIILYYIIL
jgi:hypothetical protein